MVKKKRLAIQTGGIAGLVIAFAGTGFLLDDRFASRADTIEKQKEFSVEIKDLKENLSTIKSEVQFSAGQLTAIARWIGAPEVKRERVKLDD